MPCALSIRRRKRHISTEESLDEATNSGRVDVKGRTGKKETGCETTCAELLDDGVDWAIGLIEAEDDVMEIGEVFALFLRLSVTCDVHC